MRPFSPQSFSEADTQMATLSASMKRALVVTEKRSVVCVCVSEVRGKIAKIK